MLVLISIKKPKSNQDRSTIITLVLRVNSVTNVGINANKLFFFSQKTSLFTYLFYKINEYQFVQSLDWPRNNANFSTIIRQSINFVVSLAKIVKSNGGNVTDQILLLIVAIHATSNVINKSRLSLINITKKIVREGPLQT